MILIGDSLMSSRTCLGVRGSNLLRDDRAGGSGKGSSGRSCAGGGGIEAWILATFHLRTWQSPLPGPWVNHGAEGQDHFWCGRISLIY